MISEKNEAIYAYFSNDFENLKKMLSEMKSKSKGDYEKSIYQLLRICIFSKFYIKIASESLYKIPGEIIQIFKNSLSEFSELKTKEINKILISAFQNSHLRLALAILDCGKLDVF